METIAWMSVFSLHFNLGYHSDKKNNATHVKIPIKLILYYFLNMEFDLCFFSSHGTENNTKILTV
jgi:hypothetical protein